MTRLEILSSRPWRLANHSVAPTLLSVSVEKGWRWSSSAPAICVQWSGKVGVTPGNWSQQTTLPARVFHRAFTFVGLWLPWHRDRTEKATWRDFSGQAQQNSASEQFPWGISALNESIHRTVNILSGFQQCLMKHVSWFSLAWIPDPQSHEL